MFQYNNQFYKNLFNKIHNILRNGETSLTGMAALNEINNFILLIFIEVRVKELFGENSENKRFSYLVKNYYKNTNIKYIKPVFFEELQIEYQRIITEYKKNVIISKYITSDVAKLSAFAYISQNNADEIEKYNGLCKQLYEVIIVFYSDFFKGIELTEENINKVFENIDIDMLGDAYEQFKEDEVGNQGKRAGQYFTPRSIIKYCIEDQIKPKGTESVYDSSCGTGGFIHYMNKFVTETDKDNKNQFKSNIYGNDKTAEVMKPLYINLLLHDIDIENIKNRNSLGKNNCQEYLEKFDVCVGNPPYGLKNVLKFVDFENLKNSNNEELGYNYWPPLLKTSGGELIKDSMGQFLVHVINSLKIGGRFSLVIDRGILNNGTEGNSWQKRLREWLLTCCDLQKLVLLPKGIFTHTMFDTAIIYGIKRISLEEMQTGICEVSTINLKVYIAEFEDSINKNGLVVHDEPTSILDISEIIEREWSLKYDDYIQTEEVSQEGIEYKTLGEFILKDNGGEVISKSFFNKGDKMLWSCSNKIIKTNYGKFPKEKLTNFDLLLPRNGSQIPYVKLSGENDLYTNVVQRIILNENEINKLFIYYYLNLTVYKFILNEANSIPSYNISLWKKRKIPILSPEHQERIVNFMDEFVGEDYSKLDQLVSEFKDIDLFEFLIREDYDTMGLALEYITKKNLFQTENKKFNDNRKKCCFKTVPAEMKSLGEVCEFKRGNMLTKSKLIEGEYPVIGGGKTPFGVHNKYNKEENTILCSQSGAYAGYISKYNTKVWASDCFSIHSKILDNIYLYTYLKSIQNELYKNQTGQAQPHYSMKELKIIKIIVPSLADQQRVVEMIEAIEQEDSQYHRMLDGIKSMIETVYQSITNITS
jgi:type I restriction-modification system DNA methylase subunit